MESVGLFVRIMCATALSLALLIPPQTATASDTEPPSSRRIVLVIAPFLKWEDVDQARTPNLWRLARDGAVGDVNARSRMRTENQVPTPQEGALTLSAGSWAAVDPLAAPAHSSDERYETGTAGEAYERITGRSLDGNDVVYPGMPVTVRTNIARSPEIRLGVLGQTIVDAGGSTAAIGNSDVGYATGTQRLVRPAALAAMDESGAVRYGDVSRDLLVEDPDAPFGIRTSIDRFAAVFVDTLDRIGDGPALIVLDPGDPYRATAFASQVHEDVSERHWNESLETLDGVVGLAHDALGTDDELIVVSQAHKRGSEYEGLGPIVMSGPEWSGVLSSSSTHRSGLVTNLDVTATILDSLGLERSVSVLGNTMVATEGVGEGSDPDQATAARIADLEVLDRTAVTVDSSKAGVIRTFIYTTVAALLVATLLLLRIQTFDSITMRSRTAVVRVLELVFLGILSFPLATFLMFVFVPRPQDSTTAVSALVAALLSVWAVGWLISRRRGVARAIAVISLVTTALLLVDQWLGAPLSFSTYLGYSPLMAARFYGIGNEGAAILFGASIAGFAALLDTLADDRVKRIIVDGVFPVFAILAVVTMAAPFWGANVGVAAWGTVGYGIAWLLFSGRKVTWKSALVALAVMVCLVGAFIAIDLLSPGFQTHLGRSLESARTGGLASLATIVVRKAETNLRVLTHTNWSYVLVAVLVFVGLMRWHPAGDFARALTRNPGLASGLTAGLVGGAVAYFTEDSGIVIPALIFLFIGVHIVLVMLAEAYPDSDPETVGGS